MLGGRIAHVQRDLQFGRKLLYNDDVSMEFRGVIQGTYEQKQTKKYRRLQGGLKPSVGLDDRMSAKCMPVYLRR